MSACSAKESLWRRFDAAHNTSGVQLVSVAEGVHLALVNSVAMERDACRLCAAAERQLTAVAGQRGHGVIWGSRGEFTTLESMSLDSYVNTSIVYSYW